MEYSTLLLHIGSSLCSIIAFPCGVVGVGMFMKLPPFISACKDEAKADAQQSRSYHNNIQ